MLGEVRECCESRMRIRRYQSANSSIELREREKEREKQEVAQEPKHKAASKQHLLTTHLSFMLPYLMQVRKSSKKKKFCFASSHPPPLINSCQGNLLTYFVVLKMFLGKC